MKKIRSILSVCVAIFMIFSMFCVVFADGEDGVVTINDFDEYQNLYQNNDEYEAEDENEGGYTQEQLKEEYNAYYDYLVGYYNDYVREKPIKATVLKADKVVEEYQMEYDYSISKYRMQKVTVRVDEGDYKGEETEIDYLLSADSMDNIILSKLHVGDKVFITIDVASDGSIVANISNSWATVQRLNLMICIGIIILLLTLIYAGRKGLSASLIAVIIILSTIVVVPTFAFTGAGIIWTSILLSILIIIAISMAQLGLNRNTIKAICISCIFTAFAVLLAVGFNYITRTVGTLFEYAAISENIILRNINFHSLFVMGVLLMASGVVSNTVAVYINKINRENADTYAEKIDLCREGMTSSIVVVTLLLLVAYIPNHILLLSNKFGNTEIANSETLVSEFIRIFAIVIPVIMAAPVVSLDFLKFGKKYIEEAKGEEKEEIDE